MEIYIDGEWYPRAAAKVSVFDHGLRFALVRAPSRLWNCSRLYSRA
jgi:hypothetical protein